MSYTIQGDELVQIQGAIDVGRPRVTLTELATFAVSVLDGDRGDITVSGDGLTWTIDDDAVTYAKMQNVSATARLLGRVTASAGIVEEISEASLKSAFNIEAGVDFHAYTAGGNTILGGTLTSCTGLPLTTGVTGTLPTANGGTSVNIASAALPLGSGQITFPATQNASSDANTLDDYEEGTWTPVLMDNALNASESQAYTTQTGDYVKIGQMVYLTLNIVMSSLGTLTTTQQVRIGGLPFTPDTDPSWHGGGIRGANLNLAAVNSLVCTANSGSTDHLLVYKWSATTGTAAMAISELSADGQLVVTVTYRATA